MIETLDYSLVLVLGHIFIRILHEDVVVGMLIKCSHLISG